jgi:hypothetical protein
MESTYNSQSELGDVDARSLKYNQLVKAFKKSHEFESSSQVKNKSNTSDTYTNDLKKRRVSFENIGTRIKWFYRFHNLHVFLLITARCHNSTC